MANCVTSAATGDRSRPGAGRGRPARWGR